MLRKKEAYTTITPIPGLIPRRLALDLLHSHSEIITLNPLVLSHAAIPAPRDASADEFYSTWYEVEERIQYVPGVGRMGAGHIKFRGCFHDMPWGLQTHIYAPFNIDLRHRYRVEGNEKGCGEQQQLELGLEALGAPRDGLYLREDIEIRCNVAMVSFVKAQLKTASKEMVARMMKKAELLDSGAMQAMFENGRLRSVNPNDYSRVPQPAHGGPASPSLDVSSPTVVMQGQAQEWLGRSDSTSSPRIATYHEHQRQFSMSGSPQPHSPHQYSQSPYSPPPNHHHPQYIQHGGGYAKAGMPEPMELPGDTHFPATATSPQPGIPRSGQPQTYATGQGNRGGYRGVNELPGQKDVAEKM